VDSIHAGRAVWIIHTSWYIDVWIAAICAACVLTKQHNVLNPLSGIAVGSGAMLTVQHRSAPPDC
jgi:hypothetical protein